MSRNQFDTLLATIQTLKSDMITGFNNVEVRFNNVEGRLGNIEGRFNNVEGRLDNIEGELKRIEHATQYNANHDVVVELERLVGQRK